MRDVANLTVWRRARELVSEVYEATRDFPVDERFGLTSQLRRAAVSIPANIAEGAGRGTDGELRRFLRIALGSTAEVWTLLMLSSDLGFIGATASARLGERTAEVRRMLTAFIIRLSEADR